MHIEHLAFWVAVIAVLASFNVGPLDVIRSWSQPQPASVDFTTVGEFAALDWSIPASSPRGDFYSLVHFGRPQRVLLCADSAEKSEIATTVGGGADITLAGESKLFQCTTAEANAIRVRSPEGKPRKGKIVLLTNGR